MAGNESAALEGQEAQAADQQMDKFAGFATRDGEVQKDTSTPRAAKNAAQPRNAKDGKFQKQDEQKEEDGEADEHGEQQDQAGKHKSADKRISQAVGRQRAAERRADAAERRTRDLEARLSRIEQGGLTAKPQAATAPKAPNPKDYEGGEYDTRYLADVAKHEARVAASEEVAKAQQQTGQTAKASADQARAAEFQRRRDDFFSEASETYDDFEDVVGDPDVPIGPVLGELAMESEHGAQILYELAGDRKEARRVFGLTPAKQAAWFGRREAAIESSAETQAADEGNDGDEEGEEKPKPQSGSKSKVSQAPAVPEYNSRGSGSVPKVSAATSDFAAFERMATGGKK